VTHYENKAKQSVSVYDFILY